MISHIKLSSDNLKKLWTSRKKYLYGAVTNKLHEQSNKAIQCEKKVKLSELLVNNSDKEGVRIFVLMR